MVPLTTVKRWLRSLCYKLFHCDPMRVALHVQDVIAECARTIAMLFVLGPAADYLPHKWARALARQMAFLAAITVMDNGRRAYTTMKRAFDVSDERALGLAREWLATQFCDFVALRRVARGREKPANWRIVQTNEGLLRQLRESRTPFILATGQFSREATLACFTPLVCPEGMIVAVQPEIPLVWQPRAMRLRVQYGQLLDGWYHASPGKLEYYIIGQSQRSLRERVQIPGTIIYITVDAYWFADDAYRRPFAGYGSYPVTTRPAKLARLAQCPILVCVPYIDSDGKVVLEWGPIIPPPLPEDSEADARITNSLIDALECAVGLRPTQYANAIGVGRRWNASAGQWQEDPGLCLSSSEMLKAGGS